MILNLLQELRAEVQHLRKLQSRSPNLSLPKNASVEDNLSLSVLPNGRSIICLLFLILNLDFINVRCN